MKSIICASILALILISVPAPRPSAAQTASQSAEGSFHFTSADGVTRFVEFSAVSDGKGTATGRMNYHDTSRIADKESDEGIDPRDDNSPTEFFATVEIDSMTVEKNRALMGGTIRESSHRTYLGKWVQLVVEDNFENPRLTDRLTWAFCSPQPGGWIPSDSERKDDRGAFMSWWATDAERKDDVGVPSKSLIPGEMKGCQVFLLSSYTFFDMEKWEGDIVVRSNF